MIPQPYPMSEKLFVKSGHPILDSLSFLMSLCRHRWMLWFTMGLWLFLVAGCANDEPPEEKPVLLVADRVEIAAEGGEVVVEVKANNDYEVQLLNDWISVTNTRAVQSSSRSFRVEANETGVSRVGQIVFRSGMLADTVTLFQEFVRHITLTNSYYALPVWGGTVEVEINSSVDFGTRFLSGSEWVRESTTRALSTHTLYYEVAPNGGDAPRESRILFFDKSNEELNDTITIVQSERGTSIYVSTDFSEDGRVHLLNRHTKGKGIKVVVMGDGYSDRMIADGTYMHTMRRAMEEFFELEPYRSHRDYFDFYAVTAVSINEFIDRVENQPSAFGTTFDGSSINDNVTLGGSEAYLRQMDELKGVDGKVSLADVTVMVIMNNVTETFRSFCAMYSDGFALALCFQAGNEAGIVAHEVGGHGFGKLADEYVEQGNSGTIPQEELSSLTQWQKRGWFSNVDTTSNPQQIVWNHFLTDERYAREGIGIYQGAYYYPEGVYRSRPNSIMRYHWEGDGFNAPSRLAIFKRIKQLAGEEYSIDGFITYDEVNRNAFRSSSGHPATVDRRKMTTAPPWIRNHPSSERLFRIEGGGRIPCD